MQAAGIVQDTFAGEAGEGEGGEVPSLEQVQIVNEEGRQNLNDYATPQVMTD